MRLGKTLNVSFKIFVLFFGISGTKMFMLFLSRIQIQIQNTKNIFFKTQTSGQKKIKTLSMGFAEYFVLLSVSKGRGTVNAAGFYTLGL